MHLDTMIHLLKTLVLFVNKHLSKKRRNRTVTVSKQRHRFWTTYPRIKLVGSFCCSAQGNAGWEEMIKYVSLVYKGSLSGGLRPSVPYLPEGWEKGSQLKLQENKFRLDQRGFQTEVCVTSQARVVGAFPPLTSSGTRIGTHASGMNST